MFHVLFPWAFLAACNTDVCPARQKWCPGTTVAFNVTSQVSTVVPCSGHGDCLRSPAGCTEDDPACTATCTNCTIYGGSDCGFTTAELTAKQAVRNQFFDTIVRGSYLVDAICTLPKMICLYGVGVGGWNGPCAVCGNYSDRCDDVEIVQLMMYLRVQITTVRPIRPLRTHLRRCHPMRCLNKCQHCRHC